MKDIEKYIGYYLLVYLIVLSVSGFFQYMAVCQGKSLVCAFSMNGINTIITTTAYVLTPIVAIVGFINWKEQLKYSKKVDYVLELRKEIRELESLLFNLRNKYCLDYINFSDSDKLESSYNSYLVKLNLFDKNLQKIENLFSDLNFILQTKSTEKVIINNNIAVLKILSTQSRSFHRRIYKSIIEKTPLKMTEKMARESAAYDALSDQTIVETITGAIEVDETKKIIVSLKKLKDIYLDTYEEGASKNLKLIDRLLDK